MQILLIEDNELDRTALEKVIKDHSYEYVVASTIERAKQLLATENVDVIVSNYKLADGTAMNVLQMQLPVPVIVAMELDDINLAVEALQAGAANYLIKDPNRFYAKLLPPIVNQTIQQKKKDQLTYMLSMVIKHLNHGICITDNQNLIYFVNQAFCELFEFKEEDLIGQHESVINENISQRTLSKISIDEMTSEFTYQNTSGKPIHCNIIRSTVTDGLQRLIASVTIYKDITKTLNIEQELRKKADELIRARAELEQLELFSFVSTHDLQEPLHKIIMLGNLIIADKDVILTEASKGYQQGMIIAIEDMRQMISQLHDYSKILSEGAPFTDVNLSVVINDVCNKLKLKADEFKATIQIDQLPTIKGDQRQLYKLFLNLFQNALTFRNETTAPEIHVKFTETENSIEISVEDNGIGFDEKYLPQLFKPFQRLHTQAKYPGRGLGLAICQRIMQRHMGNITSISTPGKGSIFQLTFPKKISGYRSNEDFGLHKT